jgi:hypothetical protein
VAKRTSVPDGKSLFFRSPDADPERNDGPERATGPNRQSAIFLAEAHLDWLDEKCREARKNGGRAIRKAAIIRALLDVALESPIDLTGLRREEDLVARIRSGIRG